ncbi:MAG: CPBP family intramembrane metalloprotease [Actinomycetota bacterium]|nr:CPBP family intramembrane metalloprotease [Actinomycetota bacterium]
MQWRVDARWYALALGGPIAVALVAVAVHRLVVGNDAEFGVEASTILLVPLALVAGLFTGPFQEELGWRGFALPRLLDRWSSRRASLVLGTAWACWHLPLYAIDAGGHGRPPTRGLPHLRPSSVDALHVVLVWVVTGGSLLIALLLHSATNVAGVVLLS